MLKCIDISLTESSLLLILFKTSLCGSLRFFSCASSVSCHVLFCEDPSGCYYCSMVVDISELVVLASSCVSTRAASTQKISVAYIRTAT